MGSAHDDTLYYAQEAQRRYMDALVDAMAETFKRVTGKEASDRLRDQIYDALIGHV